jgi:Fe-S cluster assembly protein SufD
MSRMMEGRAEYTMGHASTVERLREHGRERFAAIGLPRAGNESWRFTNVDVIAQTRWVREAQSETVTAADVQRFGIPDLDAAVAVFVDGVFREDLSDLSGLGAGVRCGLLADMDGDAAAQLGRLSKAHEDGFSAWNDAECGSGLVIHVAAGCEAARAIHVLSIGTNAAEPVATHPRQLIVAERGASVKVIEQYAGLSDDAVYLTNALTELIAKDEAFVEHYVLERESERAYNVSTLLIEQGASSKVHSHTVLLGGRIVRNNVIPTLAGERAHCLINGLYVGHHEQHLDNAMRVRHAAPSCESRQYYKGIMNDRSRGVFSGRIVVDKCAQKTDAIQTNRNMLLSDDARVNARPQLEIYADDVRCTHGATTGRVDDEAVFYFRSRGLSEAVARAMLVYAFAAEGFDRMELVPVRRLLAAEMIDKLPMARGLSIEV